MAPEASSERRFPEVVRTHENSIKNAISTPLLAPQASRAGNPGKPGEALGAGLGRPGLWEPLGASGSPWEPLGVVFYRVFPCLEEV